MTADSNARARPSAITTRHAAITRLMVALVLSLVAGVEVLATAAVALSETPVDPGKPRWGWFAAISSMNEWFILHGTARVTISGSSLHAELYDARDGAVAIILKGTTRGGRVEAEAVRLATEDRPRNLTGVQRKSRWKGQPGGRETILLSERGEPGGLTIGLTREFAENAQDKR